MKENNGNMLRKGDQEMASHPLWLSLHYCEYSLNVFGFCLYVCVLDILLSSS